MNQGIYPGLGMDTYHGWKLDKTNLKAGPISCSMLKSFAVSPYAWLRAPEFKRSDAMRLGSVFDAAVTDPISLDAVLDDCYGLDTSTVIAPFNDFRSKDAKEWKADAEKKKLEFISMNEAQKQRDASTAKIKEIKEHAIKAAEKVNAHEVAGEIMRGAEFQVGVIGEINGIPAKCLIDILPSEDGDWAETIVDYKTTSLGLHDDGIRKAISQFGYYKQGAFYRSLLNQVSPDRVCEDFAFIFQCTTTLEVRVVTLSDDALTLGNRWVATALKEYAKCAQRGIHSNYSKTTSTVDVLPYVAAIDEEWINSRGVEWQPRRGQKDCQACLKIGFLPAKQPPKLSTNNNNKS